MLDVGRSGAFALAALADFRGVVVKRQRSAKSLTRAVVLWILLRRYYSGKLGDILNINELVLVLSIVVWRAIKKEFIQNHLILRTGLMDQPHPQAPP